MAFLSLVAKLSLDKSGFDQGIAAANRKVGQFGASMKSSLAGAFSTAAIVAYTKHMIDFGSKVQDTAKKMNIGTDAVQEFAYAAKLSGTDLDTVSKAFLKLGEARAAALRNPLGSEASAFSSLGVNTSQSLEKVFRGVAAAFQSTDFGDDEGIIAKILFGRGGADLLPMFKAGLAEAAAEAARLGVIIDTGLVVQLDEAGDAIDRMIEQTRGPFLSAVTTVASVLAWGFKHATEMFGRNTDFWIGAANAAKKLGVKDFIKPFGAFRKVVGGGADQLAQGIEDRAQEVADKAVAGMEANAVAQRVRERFVVPAAVEHLSRGRAAAAFTGNPLTPTDSLGRIGAFSGGGSARMEGELKKLGRTMDDIKRALVERGIRIQGEF